MNKYDVIVIGGGHAGCEAAVISAKLGKSTLLATLNIKSIGLLPCNPSIGGTAKGHLVCEIDALGGIMGQVTDKAAIQIRMLNEGKGAAVRSLRAQVDKAKYHTEMMKVLNSTPNLTILEGECTKLLKDGDKITGVVINDNEIQCKSVVLATGTYLDSKIFIGDSVTSSGPAGLKNAMHLTKSLVDMGIEVRRFKTGTPARLDIESIDFDKTEVQHGNDNIRPFSFMSKQSIKNLLPCHLTYTNPTTHQIIKDNIKTSAMYSGLISGVGPRYCPSIEDKIMRFPDRTRHQVFLEPETLDGKEIYLQGMSTSMPEEIQNKFIHSVNGLENAKIIRPGYAIEYDCINPLELLPTLKHKKYNGLYFAGQINGTSGYEEAAAQGLLAGINASRYIDGKEHLTLSRTNSYIGVLTSDLTTDGTIEPYRMFTARAEYRLSLRQDNADERLTPIGNSFGTIDNKRFTAFTKKQDQLNKIRNRLTQNIITQVRRPDKTLSDFIKDEPLDLLEQISTEIKYSGYIAREQSAIAEIKRQEATALSPNQDYTKILGLRKEAQIKLQNVKPINVGQASRISGVTPADITVLLIYLRKKKL